ncbi:MAG TPA: class I SAM-dependent methyltransferase [Candidatus Acidoferrales bacterium]|nr:class I SAM-dependent methyltransferase [Candidatus Acidoferrales bacterium]
MTPPDPAPVIDLIQAFRRSKTMFTAASMGIFDLLHDAPAAAAEVAARLAANPDATERLLDACAALGLLRKREGVYENDPVADTYLRAASPHTLYGYVRYSDEALYPMWNHLADAVREGTHRWRQTFGLDGPIFSAFFHTDEAMRDFLRGMHGFGMLTSPKVVAAFDLSRFRRIVDLGSATGHLVAAACERYPELRGAVFDLPRVTAMAREEVARSSARDRIEVLAGDFFEDELPPADLYSVGQVLHDWNEAQIGRLLTRIFDRLPPGGALLVAEKILEEDGVGPIPANMQSLGMLICTEGKERSLSEYSQLLKRAGFSQVEGRRTGVPLDAILAVKP